MRLRIFSDLHIEFGDATPSTFESDGEDLVVLAGDIDLGVDGIRWAQTAFVGRPVIYVLGNHEFYGCDFEELVDDARYAAKGTNVTVLEREYVDIAGWRIMGSTLWTDFRALGPELEMPSMGDAGRRIADYRQITLNDLRLRVSYTRDRCRASHRWLAREIQASSLPTIVVTHHAPTLATESPQHSGELLNASYHNAFDELIRSPVRLWIHGHTHYNVDTHVNGIRVLTHQKGYPREQLPGFDWDRIFDIHD